MEDYSISSFSDLDSENYLKAMIAISLADGDIDEKEREFVNMQADLLSIDPSEYWAHPETNLTFLNTLSVTHPTGMAIIRDCITLGYIDGQFDDTEREKVNDIATTLKLDSSDVKKVEEWVKDLWAVMERAQTLFGPN